MLAQEIKFWKSDAVVVQSPRAWGKLQEYGQNIDISQIEKAWLNPSLQKENFTVGDFNKPLEYADNMFDAVYAIQPMTYVTDC